MPPFPFRINILNPTCIPSHSPGEKNTANISGQTYQLSLKRDKADYHPSCQGRQASYTTFTGSKGHVPMTALGTGHISPKNYVLCRNKQRLMIDLNTENNFMKEEREGKPQTERGGTSEKDFSKCIDLELFFCSDYHLFFNPR